MNKVHYSSKSDEWQTPKDLFDEYNKIYNFQLDAAATKENALCKNYFTKEDDALKQDWSKYKNIWLNPPYSDISSFIKKSYEESLKGNNIVLLIPARTDISAFHDFIVPFSGINSCSYLFSWAAGIIDGEGCIRIDKDFPSEKNSLNVPTYSLFLSVKMTDEATILKLQQIFSVGSIDIEHYDYKKNCFRWSCCGEDAFLVLQYIYPFMQTKKSQAFRGMEFQVIKRYKKYKKIPPEYLEKAEYYYNLLSQLKQIDDKKCLSVKIIYIRGRLKFKNRLLLSYKENGDFKLSPAPFPSIIVIFGEKMIDKFRKF